MLPIAVSWSPRPGSIFIDSAIAAKVGLFDLGKAAGRVTPGGGRDSPQPK